MVLKANLGNIFCSIATAWAKNVAEIGLERRKNKKMI